MGHTTRPLADVDLGSGQGTSDTGPGEDTKTFTFYDRTPLMLENWERLGMVIDHIKNDKDPDTTEDDEMTSEEWAEQQEKEEEEKRAAEEERKEDERIEKMAQDLFEQTGISTEDLHELAEDGDREELINRCIYHERYEIEEDGETDRVKVEDYLRSLRNTIEEIFAEYEGETMTLPDLYDLLRARGVAMSDEYLKTLALILAWIAEERDRKMKWEDGSEDADKAADALDYSEEDPKFGRFRCVPMKWFRNGFFQHLVWLGVCGWVDINYYDKEIILHDPWPSYNELPVGGYDAPFSRGTGEGWERAGDIGGAGSLFESMFDYMGLDEDEGRDEEKQGTNRLAALVNFLRRAVVEGYTIPGILVSHAHFDHTDDIPHILELLLMKQGVVRNHLGLEFNLTSPPLEVDDMPKIYGDYHSNKYISERIERLSEYRMQIISRIQAMQDEAGLTTEDFANNIGEAAGEQQGDSKKEKWSKALKKVGKSAGEQTLDGARTLLASSMWTANDTEAWETVRAHYESMSSDKYVEIMAEDGSRLNYSAYENNLLAEKGEASSMQKCGVLGQEFDVGHFHVLPVVWDHSKMGDPCGGRSHRKLGANERCTAFVINHKDVESSKKTMFTGSGGPMHHSYSCHRDHPDHVQDLDSPLEVDVLIDAIIPQEDPVIFALENTKIAMRAARPKNNYEQVRPHTKLNCLMKYQKNNIKVKDFVLGSHWEDFDYFLLGSSPSSGEFASGAEGEAGLLLGIPSLIGQTFYHFYGGDFVKVIDYIKAREKILGTKEAEKVFILGRVGFEWDYPLSPNELRKEIWTDPIIRDFEDEGPYKDTPEHLMAIGLCIKDVLAEKRDAWDIIGELRRLPAFSFAISAAAGFVGIAQLIGEIGKHKRDGGQEYVGREDYNSQAEFMGAFRRILRRFVGTSGGDGYI